MGGGGGGERCMKGSVYLRNICNDKCETFRLLTSDAISVVIKRKFTL